MFSWAKIKYYVIPVELVALLYAFQGYFHFQFYQQYFYQISARNMLNLSSNYSHCLNQTNIVDMSDNATFSIIQEDANHLFLVTAICTQLPPILILTVLGGFADKYGRKTIMYIIFTAQLLVNAVWLVVVYLELNMYYLLIAGVISGLSGSFGAAQMAATTYVADITPKRWLTIRIGLVNLFSFVGTTASAATSNNWLGSNGCDFHPPLWLMMGIAAVSLLYVVFLPESLTKERKKELEMKPKKGLQTWITGLKIYFWPPFIGVSRYWKVLVATAALAMVITNEVGFNEISTYYFENKPLEWSLERIGLYSIVTTVAHCIALVVVLPIMVRVGFPDILIALIGVFTVGGVGIFFGFVQHSWPTWLIFIGKEGAEWGVTEGRYCIKSLAAAGSVQSAQTFLTPTLHSMMSKLVKPDQQGESSVTVHAMIVTLSFLPGGLFSFLFTVEMSCGIIASLIYVNLYQSTGKLGGKKVSSSLIFWVMTGIWAAVVPFLL